MQEVELVIMLNHEMLTLTYSDGVERPAPMNCPSHMGFDSDALDYEEGFVCIESGRLAQASCGLMRFHKTFLAVLLSVRYQPIHDTVLVNPHPRTHLSGRILSGRILAE